MSNIEKQLEKIKQRKTIGLMTHVVIGYPTLDKTIEIVKTMAKNGVDLVELQIPFSDPLADGPTIMRACEQSLANGTKVKDAFTIMKTLTNQISIPLLFMAYYNTVFKYGVEEFCKDAKIAGAAGLIVPDMPIDEEKNEHFFAMCKIYNLHTIQVISPASTDKRLEKNAAIANGFIYCTARQGITGAKDQLDPNLIAYLKKIRQFFSIPVAVGFGISKKEHIESISPYADIAVIGSAIINVIHNSQPDEIQNNVTDFLKDIIPYP